MSDSGSCSLQPNSTTQNETLIFTYGTLKQGFPNHSLISANDAVYLGSYLTHHAYPLVCGPYDIPFLINLPGSGHRVKGELYAVSTRGLAPIDELEGITLGLFERLPIQVCAEESVGGGDGVVLVEAEAYYVHRGYGEGLWEKKGRVGLTEFTDKEGRAYLERENRSPGRSFLDEMQLLLSALVD